MNNTMRFLLMSTLSLVVSGAIAQTTQEENSSTNIWTREKVLSLYRSAHMDLSMQSLFDKGESRLNDSTLKLLLEMAKLATLPKNSEEIPFGELPWDSVVRTFRILGHDLKNAEKATLHALESVGWDLVEYGDPRIANLFRKRGAAFMLVELCAFAPKNLDQIRAVTNRLTPRENPMINDVEIAPSNFRQYVTLLRFVAHLGLGKRPGESPMSQAIEEYISTRNIDTSFIFAQ